MNSLERRIEQFFLSVFWRRMLGNSQPGSFTPPPPVVEVASATISPATVTLAYGDSQQFALVAKDAFGSVIASPPQPTWFAGSNKDGSAWGTVDSSGLFTASKNDPNDLSGFIHAVYPNGVSSQYAGITETLAPPTQTLDHLVLSISNNSIVEVDAAPTLTLSAYQTSDTSTPYTDALSPAPAYSGNNSSVATIDPTTGAITIQGPGSVTFGVTAGGKSASVDLTVTAETLTSTPSSLTGTEGDTATALVIKNQENADVTAGCTFSTSDASIATVDASGVVTYVAVGNATIHVEHTATGETVDVGVTVSAATGDTITPNIASFSGAPGDTFDLTPILDQDGVDVTDDCVCTIDDTSVATIDGPTITGMTPAIIKQGDSALTISFVGTDYVSGITIEGLPSGVTADSAVTVTDDTHCSVNLSATGSATLGDANIYLSLAGHGDTPTKVLTVNPAVASVPHSALYLTTTAATTSPTGTKSNTLPLTNNSGTIAWKKFATAHVTGGRSDVIQTTHGATTQSAFCGGWSSPLLTGGTGAIPAGTYTCKLGFKAEGSSAYKIAPVVYIYRPSDSSVVARLIDAAVGIGSVATGSDSTAGKVITFSVASAIDCLPGDLLCYEWWAIGPANDFLHAEYAGSTTIIEGGTTNSDDAMSEIVFPSTINFQS